MIAFKFDMEQDTLNIRQTSFENKYKQETIQTMVPPVATKNHTIKAVVQPSGGVTARAWSGNTILSKDTTKTDVEIESFTVQPLDELNLLGVLIDKGLSFSNHISTACKKATMWVGVLMRIRNMISIKLRRN